MRLGGHLLLAVGLTHTWLLLHHASGFPGESQEFAHVPSRSFGPFYAGPAIVLGPPGGEGRAASGGPAAGGSEFSGSPTGYHGRLPRQSAEIGFNAAASRSSSAR
ncbi:hypothetical protein VM98_37795, partial [Streptomyces rubellomurinus subsp. indigoferus]